MKAVLTLVVAGAVALGTLAAPAAAAPAPTTATTQCLANRTPAETTTHWVPGSTWAAPSPLDLRPGDVVSVTAVGQVGTGGWSGVHGPAGKPDLTWGGSWPVQGGRQYGLYGKLRESGRRFFVGDGTGCLIPERLPVVRVGERIDFGINDENPGDNVGGYTVSVKVYRNLLSDSGFEDQPHRGVSAPWGVEGPDGKGIDIGLGLANTGRSNAFIRTDSRNWNAVTQQVTLKPFTQYRMRVFLRTTADFPTGYFGARGTTTWLTERPFGRTDGYTEYSLDFSTGENPVVTAFLGYVAHGRDAFVQFDDWSIFVL
ncbi:hypothetical protein ABZ816_12615 [Actinosynnema sp. NPDC047251]|uniref:Uncharacterized protein n=1 Tax=Saccharothrix espanaensis (strain ATCC 51144 / DSM 44229 / JCM 9112 / NBRC 15066 / NRRL 15764) TaxID=1179773 RepID=K0KFY2_SACES|nr:hypothetical protein [Saccharothrix espanaensis]CCH35438.1 hypothetical protein BN6_82210 [Saccharothrix espanaensis DSM 44229]